MVCLSSKLSYTFGEKPPKKPTIYQDEDMDFSFALVVFKQIPHQQFLNSQNPEEVIFAILADFQKDQPEMVIDNILLRLKKLVNGELYLEQYAKEREINRSTFLTGYLVHIFHF